MTMSREGFYVAVEGTDGSGSSTQIQENIIPWLENQSLRYDHKRLQYGSRFGEDVVTTREPGGTEEGEYNRYMLLEQKQYKLQPAEEYERFRRGREVLSRKLITPQLLVGKFIVSERSYISSYAYQGHGLGVDIDYIVTSSEKSISPRMFKPDAWLLIHITPEEAERRFAASGAAKDTIEARPKEFFERVNKGYVEAAERFGIPVIDGTMSREEVGKACIESILDQIGRDEFDEYVKRRLAKISLR